VYHIQHLIALTPAMAQAEVPIAALLRSGEVDLICCSKPQELGVDRQSVAAPLAIAGIAT
jgi:hypothetical protein